MNLAPLVVRASVAFAISFMAGSASAELRTHCQSSETDFFTCAIAGTNKVASLCGSRKEDTNEISWLQYRFGRIGHPEMIYPLAKHGSVDKFYGRHQTSHGSAFYQYDIWFHVGVYNYSVSAYSTGDEPKEIHVYVYFEKVNRSPNSGPIQFSGSLNCAQPTEALMERLGKLLPSLPQEPETEN